REQPNSTASWDGVRTYRARNYMKNEMKIGDLVLFYHSNCAAPGVVGLAVVAKEAYPDHTSWDPASMYHDPKSTPEHPRWFMVDVKWKETFRRKVTLDQMRHSPRLKKLELLRKGQRLSVMPVSGREFEEICRLAGSVS
ncbi:MAG: EVE domain-containing protein, partial [Thermodesulfovibrionales bacterium]